MTVDSINRDYISLDQVKRQLEVDSVDGIDNDLADAISAASREIDDTTHRRFWPDPDADQVRYYSPPRPGGFEIHDLIELTSLEVGAEDSFEAWVENLDFVLEPLNAPADQRPYERVTVLRANQVFLPRSVRVTGRFGWETIPANVVSATKILTARLLLRARQAPFGVVTAGLDTGAVMRIAYQDPDAKLTGLVRETLIA